MDLHVPVDVSGSLVVMEVFRLLVIAEVLGLPMTQEGAQRSRGRENGPTILGRRGT